MHGKAHEQINISWQLFVRVKRNGLWTNQNSRENNLGHETEQSRTQNLRASWTADGRQVSLEELRKKNLFFFIGCSCNGL